MSKPIANSSKTILIISALAIVYFLFNLKSTNNNKTVLSPANQETNNQASNSNSIASQNSQANNFQKSNYKGNQPADFIANSAAKIVDLPSDAQAFDPSSVGIDINNLPDDLPEDLREQILNPPEMPADLKAQLEAQDLQLPPDIIESLNTPPKAVTIDQVNKIPAVPFNSDTRAIN